MTEDQIRELASVSVNMKNLAEAVDEIKKRIGALPTSEELRGFIAQEVASSVSRLSNRVETLEVKVNDQSPRAWMARIRDVAMTVAALAAAAGVIVAIVHTFDRIPAK
mgnify:CR=1 FL=1